MFDCFKTANRDNNGKPRSPSHPSNNTTPIDPVPVPMPDSEDEMAMRKRYQEYAFNLTCQFEGSGFAQVTDNFDGQGISLGGLQWCVGQGSLQAKILVPYFKENAPANFVEEILKQISETGISNGMALVKKHFLSGTKLHASVRKDLATFALKAKGFQLWAAEDIYRKCWGYMKENNLTSLRAFCWFFDICVQNGSTKGIPMPNDSMSRYEAFISKEGGKNKEYWTSSTPEIRRLCLWTDLRAVKNKWRADVVSRKCTIAHGIGIVHGKLFRFPEFE